MVSLDCVSALTVLCLIFSRKSPYPSYINWLEPTLTHQIPSPPTTTIPSSGTSGLGPCPRVPGACSRRWDDEGSQEASSCTSIPGKQSPHRSSSTVIDANLLFTGWRKVEATGGLQGAGYGRRWGPILPPASKWAVLWHLPVQCPGIVWQRLAIWSGAVRRVGVIAEMGRARERDAGTHRGGTPALAPTAPLCDAGWPYRLSLFFFVFFLGLQVWSHLPMHIR